MRIIIGDSETTGLSVRKGDRMIEIGLIETENFVPTGRVFHEFIDPAPRAIHWAAVKVHGLTAKILQGQPAFADIAAPMLDFIGDGEVWFHNAPFDMGFIDHHLKETGLDRPLRSVNTMDVFRKKVKLPDYKLDTVVAHYGISTPDRSLHGAMLDASILTAAVARAHGLPELNIRKVFDLGNESRVTRQGAKPKVRQAPSAPEPREPPPRRRTAPPPDPRAPKPDPDAVRRVETIEASEHPDDPMVRERRAVMIATIRSAFTRAASFRDFLNLLMKEHVSVRPHLTLSGQLDDMRFNSRNVSFRAEDLGCGMALFASGPLAYDRMADRDHLAALRDAFDRHFRPGSAPPPREAESAPARTCEAINARRPSLDPALYANLPADRDVWSDAPPSEIFQIAAQKMSPEQTRLMAPVPMGHRLSTLRWVCRGLSPEHAICMLASRAPQYRSVPVPENVLRAAREMADGPEPAPRDRSAETSRSERPAKAYAEIPIGERVRILAAGMNSRPVSLDPSSYREMRLGDERDGWSAAPHDDIHAYVAEILSGRGDGLAEAIDNFEKPHVLGLKRWICRGLSPEHALCMTVARAPLYRYEPGDTAIAVARGLAAGGLSPEP